MFWCNTEYIEADTDEGVSVTWSSSTGCLTGNVACNEGETLLDEVMLSIEGRSNSQVD
jgi:hypothetical protein